MQNQKNSTIKHLKILLNGKPYINPKNTNVDYIYIKPEKVHKNLNIEYMAYNGNSDQGATYNLDHLETRSIYSEDSDNKSASEEEIYFENYLEFIVFEIQNLDKLNLKNGDIVTLPPQTSFTGPMDINWNKNTLHLGENYSLGNCTIEINDNNLIIAPLTGEYELNNIEFL